jgi:hypothetical protein
LYFHIFIGFGDAKIKYVINIGIRRVHWRFTSYLIVVDKERIILIGEMYVFTENRLSKKLRIII